MKKRICSLLICSLLVAIFSIPAFASTWKWCSCGTAMEGNTHYTPWLTVSYRDCVHGHLYSRDANVERLAITTYVCRKCGKGFTEQEQQTDIQCLATKTANLDLTEGDTCPVCLENAVLTKTHETPWLTTATNENGISTQERIVVKTSVCGNCGQGGTTNETETRTIRLHQYQ